MTKFHGGYSESAGNKQKLDEIRGFQAEPIMPKSGAGVEPNIVACHDHFSKEAD